MRDGRLRSRSDNPAGFILMMIVYVDYLFSLRPISPVTTQLTAGIVGGGIEWINLRV